MRVDNVTANHLKRSPLSNTHLLLPKRDSVHRLCKILLVASLGLLAFLIVAHLFSHDDADLRLALPRKEIILEENGINLRFNPESKGMARIIVKVDDHGHENMSEALVDLRSYLLRSQLQVCTSQSELKTHFTTTYSLLPRLYSTCIPGRMRLALTKEALSDCLTKWEDEYCFAFFDVHDKLPSEKILVASPDYGLNRRDFSLAPFGVVFPYWPMAPVTVHTPQPMFNTHRVIMNPSRRAYIIGTDLGRLSGNAKEELPSIITSLSNVAQVNVSIRSSGNRECFPNETLPMRETQEFLPCSQARNIIQKSSFCLIVVNDWENITPSAVRSIHAQLWTCLKFHSIPLIPTHYVKENAEKVLPFFGLLESLWSRAIVFQPFINASDFVHRLMEIFSNEGVVLMDKGAKLFNRHLATVGKQVETAVAALNRALSFPQPALPVVKTYQTGRIQDTRVHIYEVYDYPKESKSFMPSGLVQPNEECDPPSDDAFEGPLWTLETSPWQRCKASEEETRNLSNTFTVIFLTYDRTAMLISNIKRFLQIQDLIHSILVVWNHPTLKPESFVWPQTPFPINVIRVPLNKLQSRFLPFDIIKTDAVLTLDDEVVPDGKSTRAGFSLWKEHPDRLVGFVARGHKWYDRMGQFRYVATAQPTYSFILTGASFFHKYYLYAYTFELLHEIYAVVDEIMNCEDIAMNMLTQQISEKPPLRVISGTRFACPSCTEGLSRKKGHYHMRSACITNFIHLFGYDPLKTTNFMKKV
uniref:Glyco_transf_64 domain-containing protein n=1 Tax=Mesocestoides corti TaxID=53468 RepID=A0A5K3F562_MESCO